MKPIAPRMPMPAQAILGFEVGAGEPRGQPGGTEDPEQLASQRESTLPLRWCSGSFRAMIRTP
ncbi:hypothetical protein ABZY34_04770 [Streptomyces virginiae]|uniref:hypothetical protein n=1 Tax=Streptomyces virginiae TaxID=1961 RepID=UPI0033AE8D8D